MFPVLPFFFVRSLETCPTDWTRCRAQVEYVPSDFVPHAPDELAILSHIFDREEKALASTGASAASAPGSPGLSLDAAGRRGQQQQQPLLQGGGGGGDDGFNVLVDLCGVFKRSSVHQIRDLVLSHFGPDRFHYIYHIDQADSSDRYVEPATNKAASKFDFTTFGRA
jgi:hypothetical protein